MAQHLRHASAQSLELVESLPMSGAGKILKRELRAQHWGGSDRGVS